MREMPTVRQIHRENFVARFYGGEINRHVRLCAAVRLHIHVLAAEKPFRAINGQLLGNVHVLAATIPAFSRITFGILVCQHAALRFHDCATREILRRNQFDIFPLPFFFGGDCVENFGIDSAQRIAVSRRGCRAN